MRNLTYLWETGTLFSETRSPLRTPYTFHHKAETHVQETWINFQETVTHFSQTGSDPFLEFLVISGLNSTFCKYGESYNMPLELISIVNKKKSENLIKLSL